MTHDRPGRLSGRGRSAALLAVVVALATAALASRSGPCEAPVPPVVPSAQAEAPRPAPGLIATGLVQICPPRPGKAGVQAMACSVTGLMPGQTAVSPAMLAWRAYSRLRPPLLDPRTASPRGIAGLPGWFRVPEIRWERRTVRIAASGLWAVVTVIPSRLAIGPGGRLPAAPGSGPGTACYPVLPAIEQRAACSCTCQQSPCRLPGDRLRVTITVTWAAAWRGSDGTGGVMPPLTATTDVTLPAAGVQAVTMGGTP